MSTVFQRPCQCLSSLRCTYRHNALLSDAELHSDRTSYLLGQGLGGIIFSPYSEAFGRKKLYIVSTGLYSIFCAMIAVVPSLAGIVISRFMTGVLSGIPTTITAGSIEDLSNAKDRIWFIFLWSMISNLGLALGPIMSAYIIAGLGW